MMKKTIRLGIIIAVFCFSFVFLSNNTSALTYSSSVDVGFTFNPTLSVNISGDLLINNLTPGAASDSNIVNVTVATNASGGYVLKATCGTKTTNTDLVNQSNSAYKFSSIATNASLASLTTDNTWGFSYSSDSGSTWSNYSGLPLDNDDEGATGKQLLSTTTPLDNKTIQFKIGAKAASSQATGTYMNTINFYAVANPDPGRSYTINFIDAAGHATGMPAQQTGTISSNQIVLSDNGPEGIEDYYSFEGWCDQYTIDDNCSGITYYPGDDYEISGSSQNVIIELYALWYYDQSAFCNENPSATECNGGDPGGGDNPGEPDCDGPIPDPECGTDPGF